MTAASSVAVGSGLPDYTAVAQTASFWPRDARLVISISMQFEAGAQGETDNGSPFSDVKKGEYDPITESWFQYGLNEGIPRLLDLWDRHAIKVTSHMVGRAVERRPDIAKEIVDRGHEAAAHGHTWTAHWRLTAQQERESIIANVAAIEKATGTRPVGYNSFGMRGTKYLLKTLQSLNFSYYTDDISRDEPSMLAVDNAPFVVVPYTHRNNDFFRLVPAMTSAGFAQDLKDGFDALYAEAANRRRMMSISTHDRIAGAPAHVKAIEDFIMYAKKQPGVHFLRKDEIAKFTRQARDVPRAYYRT